MSKKELMFAMVEQWRASGLTCKSFAIQHGFEIGSFKYWCKKQYKEVVRNDQSITISPQARGAMPDFVEITSGLKMIAQNQPIRMEFELPCGVRIKIY